MGRDFWGHLDGRPPAAAFFPSWVSDSGNVTLSLKRAQLLALHSGTEIVSSAKEGLMWRSEKWIKGTEWIMPEGDGA